MRELSPQATEGEKKFWFYMEFMYLSKLFYLSPSQLR